MAVKSLKNLDSFSRGYIEGRTTQVDFDTTLSGDVKTQVSASTTVTFTKVLVKNKGDHNEVSPKKGQVVSGLGIVGIPKIIDFVLDNGSGETEIVLDIAQTIAQDTFLTLSDSNAGLDQFDIVGSTLSRSKEDLRVDQLVPAELLGHTTDDNESGGIKTFLDAYYKFMNTEEFLYKEIETFEDVVINNVATIRIPDPDLKNNRFFSREAARSSVIIDSEGNTLTVGDSTTTSDVAIDNINIFNVDNLPSKMSLENFSGRTLSITGLPSRLNNKKITVKTSVQNLVISNPSFKLNTLEDALNINENDEDMLNMMQKEIAPAIDQNVKVNKRALYQRLIDFYKIRGSRDSIDLFFKLFFQDEEIDVEYPWNSTLKTSSGNWDNQTLLASTYDKQTALVSASDAAAGDLYGTSISLDTNTNLLAVGSPSDEATTVDILTDAAANAGSNNKTIPLANTTGLQVGMIVTSVTDASNITADSKIASIVDGVSIILDKNIAENIGSGDTIRFTGQVDAGAVYIYDTNNDGATYSSQVKLVSPTGAAGDNFGSEVSLSGEVLAISNPDDTEFTGGTAANSGSVEIWQRFLTQAPSTFTWRLQKKLVESAGGLNFGHDISLDGDTLAIACPGYVNTDRSNGAVQLYKGTGSSWLLSQVIPTPLELNEAGLNDWATHIVLRGNHLLVSWSHSDNDRGSVSVFHKNPSTGLFETTPEAILKPTDLSVNDLFGAVIDIDNTSNPLKPICAISATGSRTVYLFERETHNGVAEWNQIQKLNAGVGQSDDGFGLSVKIYNNNVLVGAPLSNGVGDVATANSGVVYHFENSDQWLEKAVYSEVVAANNKFGSALEISRNSVYNMLVGTPGSSSGGHIVNFIRPSQAGKYLNNEGFLSDNQKIQDSEFYQKFSYVIKAGRNISQWKDTYNKLVHPAGFKYFGEILIVIKAVRDVLGDGADKDGPRTTITEKTTDIFGNEITEERDLIAYSNAASFRKTFSSMPGVQPGFIGDEDLGLLIIALASFFSPVSDARSNRSARLSIVKLETGGAIPADGVSIVESGAGYNTAPTVTASDGSGAVFETTVNRFGEVVDVIVKGGHPLTASTPATPTSFIFNGATNSSRTAGSKTGKSTGGSRSSGSGVNGVVTIVVAADKTITSVTPTTAGTGYKVGEVITIPGSDLGGGADLLLTVNEVHSGTGYTANSSLTVQALSAVANSGAETAIGKVTDLTEITLASNPLTAGIFYKILDLGNATFANFNTISSDDYDRAKWQVGDIFQAATTGSSLSTTAKLQIAEIGLTFNLKSNKKYRIPPIVKIATPDAIDSLGLPLGTNVNATAKLTINTEIALNDTALLALNERYIIAFKGTATDANFNTLARDNQTTWKAGDTFVAVNDGSGLSGATTATVVPYDSTGKLTGFQITNAGLGYINDPIVHIQSNSIHEKRVPNVIPVRIVTNGNDIQTIDIDSGRVTVASINRTNNYFGRKDYNTKAILGPKKFTGEYNISQFASLSIENVSQSTINKFNTNTIIQPEKDRNS